MHVLYISNRINAEDGSSVHGREFYRAVQALGHTIITYPPVADGPAAKRSLPLRAVGRIKSILRRAHPGLRDTVQLVDGYFAARRARREILARCAAHPPDIVVYRAVMFDFIPNLLRADFDVPWVAELNAIKSVEDDTFTAIGRWVEALYLRPATAIAGVSKPIIEHLRAAGETRPLAVVENGVDLDKFYPDPIRASAVKQRLGLDDRLVVGYVGSFKRWHGLDTTLDVLERLLAANAPVQLLLVGGGETEDGIRDRVKRGPLKDAVTFTGNVPHEQVPDYVRAIDVALMTYPAMEQFYFSPLKMYEYIAAGTTVVSSSLGQITSSLAGRRFGALVQPGDIDGFVAALLALLNPERLNELSRAARSWAEQHYAWQRNAAKVLELGQPGDPR